MKNIEEIMKDAGLEVTDEQVKAITKAVGENYKTVADYDKQKEKLTASEDKVKTLTENLEKFKDVDPEKLNSEIQKLKDDLAAKDKEYADKISDRDFDDLIKDAIGKAGGKNAKAIRALLDTDALKASKNQKDDIEAAIKALTEAEDSAMLFTAAGDAGSAGASGATSKIDAIGKVGTGGAGSDYEKSLRAAMGLSASTEKGDK